MRDLPRGFPKIDSVLIDPSRVRVDHLNGRLSGGENRSFERDDDCSARCRSLIDRHEYVAHASSPPRANDVRSGRIPHEYMRSIDRLHGCLEDDMRDVRRVVLTGFSGSGKSTVALLLSARLGWHPVDNDIDIEIETGKTIPEIFATDGEAAF